MVKWRKRFLDRRLDHRRTHVNDKVRDVVADAAAEVARPIAFATAIVITVFLPLLSMSGIAGRMYQPLASASRTYLQTPPVGITSDDR